LSAWRVLSDTAKPATNLLHAGFQMLLT